MILEAIKKRYSVRHYKDQPVEEDKLGEVLEAARLAPSGCNLQPWKLVVVRDRATIQSMVHAIGGQQFVEQAPVLIVACMNGVGYNIGHRYDGAVIDITIAGPHDPAGCVDGSGDVLAWQLRWQRGPCAAWHTIGEPRRRHPWFGVPRRESSAPARSTQAPGRTRLLGEVHRLTDD